MKLYHTMCQNYITKGDRILIANREIIKFSHKSGQTFYKMRLLLQNVAITRNQGIPTNIASMKN